ncbi:MAG: alpha-L-fucosidase [Bacteroidaceae bacterium]|nr:alpha-L-fucosidase [Bacteroidaceae bacterium]
MRNIKLTAALIGCMAFGNVMGQSFVHDASTEYQWPEDSLVVSKLKSWQDLKFGIILHWGVYSVPGMVESWQITSEDWITPDPVRSYEELKQWYWGLSKDFNPTKFDPAQWAKVSKEAGMKYVVFTTKHHDGFCLWDTKTTDYSVAHSGFAGNPKVDVAKHVFDAFRGEGLWAGCYFSKPDWHSDYYWWRAKATPNRMHNYQIKDYPERWAKYQKFVYDQVDELMNNYGKFDILWLDGGWCTAPKEDIKLDDIVENARKAQPGLIVVERACPGKHENYQTPEQTIPDHQINNPWESCITLTYDWGWTNHPVFKTPAKVIATLTEIVAKGGSLLLGVGPTPEGLIEDGSVEILQKIGKWMNANGEAIYATVTTPVYQNEDKTVWFTANKDGKTLYAIVPQDDEKGLPTTVTWEGNAPLKGTKMINLATKKAVKYVSKDNRTTVYLPTGTDGIALKFKTKK